MYHLLSEELVIVLKQWMYVKCNFENKRDVSFYGNFTVMCCIILLL